MYSTGYPHASGVSCACLNFHHVSNCGDRRRALMLAQLTPGVSLEILQVISSLHCG